MAVDTNELLNRIGAVLRGISDKMDRLIEIGERPAREIQLHEMLEDSGGRQTDHFAGANKMVADEPAKEAEHPAGPKPDPGEGGCEPTEKDIGGGVEVIVTARWIDGGRSPAEAPAKEPVPAWEPKVGDWVRVTRPQNWQECRNPDWSTVMHQYDDNVMQVSCYEKRWGAWVANFYGVDWFFHRDWLSPAEPPATEKPPEPEYREPVLPADCGKGCEFSDDSISWEEGDLIGWRANLNTFNWESDHDSYRYARIRKNA